MNKDNQKELFIVVDEKDNILDYKTRFECHHNLSLIHRGVGVMIFNKKGEILMQKRSRFKDFYPGFFTISAGGHVGVGETYEQAAERELYEELGVSLSLKKVSKFFLVKTDKEKEMTVLFKACYDGKFRVNKDEVEAVNFFDKKDLSKIIKEITPTAKIYLKKLNFL